MNDGRGKEGKPSGDTEGGGGKGTAQDINPSKKASVHSPPKRRKGGFPGNKKTKKKRNVSKKEHPDRSRNLTAYKKFWEKWDRDPAKSKIGEGEGMIFFRKKGIELRRLPESCQR